MYRSILRRPAILAAGALALAVPAVAHAEPLPVANDVYKLTPLAAGLYGTTGSGAQLFQGGEITSLVKDHDFGGGFQLTPQPAMRIEHGYRETLDTGLERCRGCGGPNLTAERDTELFGQGRGSSYVRVTLRVTNSGTAATKVGLETIVPVRAGDQRFPTLVTEYGEPVRHPASFADPQFRSFGMEGYQKLGRAADPPSTVRAIWSAGKTGLGGTAPQVVQVADRGAADAEDTFAEPLDQDFTFGPELRYYRGMTPESAVSLAPGDTTELTVFATAETLVDPTPVITGKPQVGSKLTIDPATLPQATPLSPIRAYRWVSCPPSGPGAGCEPVAYDQTGAYVVKAADAGRKLLVAVYPTFGDEVASEFVTVLAGDATPDMQVVVKEPQQPAPAAEAPVAPAAASTPPAPTPAPAVTVRTPDRKLTVRFRAGSAKLTPAVKRVLRRVAATADATITCSGYTASANGKANYRSALALRRAKAVCAFLAARIEGAVITTSSAAGADPVASNKTKQGRARNARVELTVKA